MPLLLLMNWILMYLSNILMYHLLIILIVSGYTRSMKISMENPYWREWMPTSLCENSRRYYPKEIIPELIDLIVIWYVIFVLWFSTHTVLTGVFLMFLGKSPVLWLCHPRYVLGIGVCLSATGSLLCSWLHSYVSWILGRPYLPFGFDCCHVWVRVVFCRIWCRTSERCVLVLLHLWVSSSICITTFRRRRLLKWVLRWPC